METFKFIVINKNDMTKLAHFSTADRVVAHLIGTKLDNIIVLVNEDIILHLKDIPIGDAHSFEGTLEAFSKLSDFSYYDTDKP
jgi:hypothetical protein